MAQRISFDELYRHSTQYRLWSFTGDELAERRKQANEAGIRKVQQRLEQMPDVVSQIETVSVEEELMIITFYSRRIGQLAKFFNMPSQVRATAISFLRKFYLVRSVMEFHPKLVLLTCLFLAAKSENFFIGINSFCKRIPKTTPESILSLEFDILQSLGFTLFTHHPFRPLYGFFFDLQEVLKDDATPKELGKLYDSARASIDESLISDAPYYFTPPQIALACLKNVDSSIVEKYLQKKFQKLPEIKEEEENDDNKQPQESEETSIVTGYEELLRVIEDCQETIRSAQNPTKEEATAIDRKVQYCINPELVLKRKRENTVDSNEELKKQRTETPDI